MKEGELTDKLREIDALMYMLTAAYFEDDMTAEEVSQFERWFDMKKIDSFNSDLRTKKKFYDESV